MISLDQLKKLALAGLIGATIGLALGGIHYALSSPVFESSGSLTVFRQQTDSPSLSEPGRDNRWVWIRDGMTLEKAMLTDDRLNQLVVANQELNQRMQALEKGGLSKAQARGVFLDGLRRQIVVDYTGGDSNTYVIKVRDGDPKLAATIADNVLTALRTTIIEEHSYSYQAAETSLRSELAALSNQSESRATTIELLTSALDKLTVARVIAVSQLDKRIRITKRPYPAAGPLWPRLLVSLLLGIVGGGGAGIALAYCHWFIVSYRDQTNAPTT